MEANFDPADLVSECRDLGNARFGEREFQKAEEAFTLGLTIYEMYGCDDARTAGYGCLIGLVDCLRAQSRHAEADALLHESRQRMRKIA